MFVCRRKQEMGRFGIGDARDELLHCILCILAKKQRRISVWGIEKRPA